MAANETKPYEIDAHVAELYDQLVTGMEEVSFIHRLLGDSGPKRVLEVFCGTGRILLPLAQAGHTVTGLDQSHAMLERACQKAAQLPAEIQNRVRLVERDALATTWPDGFEVVVMAGNSFYELAAPEEQAACIAAASQALVPGGFVLIDNDHMEGELDPGWTRPEVKPSFPSGTCEDGTRLEGTIQTTWFDARKRLVRFKRRVKVTRPDGQVAQIEYEQQKHPVSAEEVRGWLEASGFEIVAEYGDHDGSPYMPESRRAIFWAQRRGAR